MENKPINGQTIFAASAIILGAALGATTTALRPDAWLILTMLIYTFINSLASLTSSGIIEEGKEHQAPEPLIALLLGTAALYLVIGRGERDAEQSKLLVITAATIATMLHLVAWGRIIKTNNHDNQ